MDPGYLAGVLFLQNQAVKAAARRLLDDFALIRPVLGLTPSGRRETRRPNPPSCGFVGGQRQFLASLRALEMATAAIGLAPLHPAIAPSARVCVLRNGRENNGAGL
jgi:hypothetical protein